MKRRGFLALSGAAIMAFALSACTSFAPVYGDISGGGLASAKFNFAPPTNRHEQIVLNRLKVAFPNPAGPSDPLLRVAANTSSPGSAMSDAYEMGYPTNVRVTATVTIVQADQTLFTATRFADTAYQDRKLSPTNAASAEGARETAAESAAEALRAAILAGYRPGAVSTQPR